MGNRTKTLCSFLMLWMVGISPVVYAQTRDVVIEGTLKMYYLNKMGDVVFVTTYRKTDYVNSYLAFVVDCGKNMNISPYLDEGDRELLDDAPQSSFMISPHFKYSAKEFAVNYANHRVRVRGNLYVPGGGWRNATFVVMDLKEIKLANGQQPSKGLTTNNKRIFQQSNKNNKINITGRWSCASEEKAENQFGEIFPSWTFDLKVKVTGNEIKGNYFASYPLCMRFDGNLYDNDEDNFDIKGRWDGEKYVVKYHSSHDADVVAYIKPITTRKIEWRIISAKGGCTMAPQKAVLIKEQ